MADGGDAATAGAGGSSSAMETTTAGDDESNGGGGVVGDASVAEELAGGAGGAAVSGFTGAPPAEPPVSLEGLPSVDTAPASDGSSASTDDDGPEWTLVRVVDARLREGDGGFRLDVEYEAPEGWEITVVRAGDEEGFREYRVLGRRAADSDSAAAGVADGGAASLRTASLADEIPPEVVGAIFHGLDATGQEAAHVTAVPRSP